MDFTEITDAQKDELRLKHLKAHLLQDTSVSVIFFDDKKYKDLLDDHQSMVDNFRKSIMSANNEDAVKNSLSIYLSRCSSFLDPDNTSDAKRKKILTAFKNSSSGIHSITPEDIQVFSYIEDINSNLGFYNDVEDSDFFNRFEKKSEVQVEKISELFSKKLEVEVVNDLFELKSENASNNLLQLRFLAENPIEVVEKSTQSIDKNENYNSFKIECQDLMYRFGFKQFIFDVNSVEDIVDFKKNLSVLTTAITDVAEVLGISENSFAMKDSLFRYYDRDDGSLGSYTHESGKFSINSKALSSLQKTILSDDVDASIEALNGVSSIIIHEWMHLLDMKIVKKIQESQLEQGLEPQFKYNKEDKDSYKKGADALTETDIPVYGLHRPEYKNLREAIAEFREIQRDFLNENPSSLKNDEGARREFMEIFWKGATNVKSPLNKPELFTEKAFDTVFSYLHNPDNSKNEKKFDKFLKSNDASLLNTGFFFHSQSTTLKKPLSPELLDVHNKMINSLSKATPVLTESKKSQFYKDAETLDKTYNKNYFSKKLEMFARYVQSNFYPLKNEDLRFPTYNEERADNLSNKLSSIIGKTFGVSVLNEETQDLFMKENPGYNEKPEPNNFMLASKKFIDIIKTTLGIKDDESYQLPMREKDDIQLKIMRVGKLVVEDQESLKNSKIQIK